MEVQDAVTDYLLDITHLDKRTQVVYRQRLTVFADWCKDAVTLEKGTTRRFQRFFPNSPPSNGPIRKGGPGSPPLPMAGIGGFSGRSSTWATRERDLTRNVNWYTV